MSNGLPLLARCQPSILVCQGRRTASSSRFFGPSFAMMAESPAQNASGEIPVLGVASLAMKSNRTGAIFNPWASTRFIMGFLNQNGVYRLLFRRKAAKTRPKGSVHSPFSAKATEMRSPLAALGCASNIGGEVHEFVEQDAGPRQHLLDLVGVLGNRGCRSIDRQLALGRWLVIMRDPGEPMQRTRARLGVVALGVAALADFGRGRDIDFAECGIRDAARRGAVFLRG